MQKHPIVIVGGGPAGLACGIYLSMQGVPSIIVERRTDVNPHPRAHWLNTRTVELFHQLGIYDEVCEEALPLKYMHFELTAMIGGMSMDDRKRIAPVLATSVAQDVAEHAMLRKLADLGDLCTLRRGLAYVGVEQDADGATVTVRHADGHEERIAASYVIAADGAHSPVRNALGIAMIGDPAVDSILNIYFHADILRPGSLPSVGVQSEDDVIKGAFINMDGKIRYTFQYMLEPGENPDDFDPERCEAMIRAASKMPADRPVEVKSIKPWTMSAHVAERFGEGRIFLVGDAAHAFPPSGGFGMNSAVVDAHNLSWKLALAWRGLAGPDLLASYEHERQPIAFFNTAQSFRNSQTINLRGQDIPINIAPEVLADINARSTRSLESQLPALVPKSDEWELMGMLEHGSSMGQEIGYSYLDSPVVARDGREEVVLKVIEFRAHGTPGARAPHFWLTHKGKRISSIELFTDHFVLLTGPQGHAWQTAAAAIDGPVGLECIRVGDDDHVVEDADFAALVGIDADGAVLVRPDGHIAFRAQNANGDLVAALRSALATATGFGTADRQAAAA